MSRWDDEWQEAHDLERDLVALLDIAPGSAARRKRHNGMMAAIPIALLVGGLFTGVVQTDGSLWATADSETAARAFTVPDQASHSEPAGAPRAVSEIALAIPDIEQARAIEPAEAPRAEAREPTRAGATAKLVLATSDRPSKPASSKKRPPKKHAFRPGEPDREAYRTEYAITELGEHFLDGGDDYRQVLRDANGGVDEGRGYDEDRSAKRRRGKSVGAIFRKLTGGLFGRGDARGHDEADATMAEGGASATAGAAIEHGDDR